MSYVTRSTRRLSYADATIVRAIVKQGPIGTGVTLHRQQAVLDEPDPGPGDEAGQALLERDAALGAVAAALDGVRAGSGAVVLLIAPAGMGKTAVIERGRRMASAAGLRAASAVGSPMETGLPFGFIGQALAGLGATANDDLAGLERAGDQATRLYRLFRWLVATAAAGPPLLLALDDLHWADADSLELVGFICRRLAGCPIVVLGSLRPEPDRAGTLARELVGSGHARLVPIEPLSREASGTLLSRAMSHRLDEEECDRLWRACAGTPLLLGAAALALERQGTLPVHPADGPGFGRALLLDRFVGVGPDAVDYVRAAAVLGVRFDAALAGALAGFDDGRAAAAHRRLVRSGLLQDLGRGRTAFVHPLLAQELLDSRSPSERERGHADAFRLLVERGAPDALAAEHAVAGKMVGDPLAVEVATRAGRSALAQGALEAACTHLGHAVSLAGDAADQPLLLDYAASLAALARIEDAERVCGDLLSRPDAGPAVRARALVLLARTASVAGRPGEAERLYEEAAASAVLVDPATHAATLADAANTCHITSTTTWTLAATSQALAILPPGDPQRRPLEVLEAWTRLMEGDASGTALLAAEARRWRSRGEPDVGWTWTSAVCTVNALSLLEDHDAATAVLEREFHLAVESGAPILMVALAIAYSQALARVGQLTEALDWVRGAIALSGPLIPWSDLALVTLLIDLGRDDEADPHIARLREVIDRVSPKYYASVTLWLDLIQGRRLLAAGEPHAASAAMSHAGEIAALTGRRHPGIVLWAGVAIDAHLVAGRIEAAVGVIEQLEESVRALTCRWPKAALALGRAQLDAVEGRDQAADHGFQGALREFEALSMPVHHAEALVAYGSYLRRAGRPRQAREPIARALEIAQRCRAERVVRVASAELAAAGGRRRRQGDRSGLTAQEQRVAELAADGLTNAEIAHAIHLSPKTVGHHLERVYSKLGIRSRRELIRSRDTLLAAAEPPAADVDAT